MKKRTIIAVVLALTLAACSTTQSSNSTSSSASSTPVTKLGTITNKETIVSQNTSRGNPLPIDINVGIGGGGNIGWGVGLGLGQLIGGLLSRTTTSTDYQYNIKVNNAESLTLRSQQDFAVGSCLTVLTLEGNSSYPKIEANPSCQLASVVKN